MKVHTTTCSLYECNETEQTNLLSRRSMVTMNYRNIETAMQINKTTYRLVSPLSRLGWSECGVDTQRFTVKPDRAAKNFWLIRTLTLAELGCSKVHAGIRCLSNLLLLTHTFSLIKFNLLFGVILSLDVISCISCNRYALVAKFVFLTSSASSGEILITTIKNINDFTVKSP